jgi:hypothetical protein
MSYITLTKEEFDELSSILDGYCNPETGIEASEEYKDKKWELDNKFCGLTIWGEEQIINAELRIGNTYICDNILTCIYNNEIHKYKMISRPAQNRDLAYIISATEYTPFNLKYIGRCFIVDRHVENDEWVVNHVVVDLGLGYKCGWCLYDDQYVVLEEIH